ncbi:glycosyltransferase [Moraxella sp. FZFQ2102]|uniref:glycosyltransferase n=1 Tax=Moraxella sp. FZFQ2102 TaxID=2953752 RepID=UPI00209BD092|nr:glycosyltransferase [Moraxella sp. FZFQ2102]USZ14928.1 glycosyltransferase [Moraxella sp. FZFQ2102]
MKKTVVLAIFTLQGNGAERFALTLAKGLVDAGHDAHIVYFKPIIDLPVPDGVQLHYFDYRRYRILPKFMRSAVACAAFDRFVMREIGMPDLVLSNLYPVDLILHKSKLPNVHFVIHSITSEEYKPISQKKLEHLKKIYQSKPCIGVSQGAAMDLKSLFGDMVSIKTIYNPIDIERIIQDSNAYLPGMENYLICVGKFKDSKRHDILIHAYAKSKKLKPLVLVGKGELQSKYQNLVNSLGLEDKVIFAGFQKNPLSLDKAHRCNDFSIGL